DRYLAAGTGLVGRLLETPGTVSKLVVFLKPGADARASAHRIETALNGAGYPVTIRSWREVAPFYEQVQLLDSVLSGFVANVVVNAALVMTMTVTDRTRKIGALRAIGTRPSRILTLFLAEALAIALVGCVAGALFALVVRAGLNASGIMLPPPPGATHGAPIHVRFYWLAYAAGLL